VIILAGEVGECDFWYPPIECWQIRTNAAVFHRTIQISV
jgi:hypothetical protein